MMGRNAKSIAEKLRAALDAGCLTQQDAARGEKVLAALKRPARITAIGQPGSGKSTVLNALLGENVVPQNTDATIVEIVGQQAGQEDNAIHQATVDSDAPDGCSHILKMLPLAKLNGKHLIKIDLPEGAPEQERVLRWMEQNTDIVIWCTNGLEQEELAIWSIVQDALKDHSFLALTHADQLMAQGSLTQLTERFQKYFADDFMGFYPIAAKHALSACRAGSVVDAQLWRASGAAALLQGLEQDIASGKQADLDYADAMTAGCEPLPPDAKRPDIRKVSSDNPTGGPGIEVPPRSDAGHCISPMKRSEAITTALTVLQAPVDEMLRKIENKMPEPANVLDHTAQAAQALATLFMDASPDDPDLNTFRDNVLEYEQLVFLLQLEGTENAARDAATALLQLKKEMSEVAYA